MKAKACIGLDIGSKAIKAVQLSVRKGSRYAITEYARAPFNPDLPASDQIRDLLNQRPFDAPLLVTAVSGRNVFVRHHVMPAVSDPKQLVEAVKYEIGKFVPIADVSEVVYDCQRLEETGRNDQGESEMRVLIAGTRRSHLDTFLSTLDGCGVQPDIIDVDVCALANAYWLLSLTNPDATDLKSTVALVNVGAAKVDVHIVRGFNSYFARESYKGGDDITDAISKRFALDPAQAEQMKINPGDNLLTVLESIEAVVYDICNDARAALDYFEAQYDVTVDEILLTGGAANTPGLREGMEKVCQKKVTKWRLAELLPRELSEESENVLRESFDEATLALGLAARLAQEEISGDRRAVPKSRPAPAGGPPEEAAAPPPPSGGPTVTASPAGEPPDETTPMIWIPEEQQEQEGEEPKS